MTNEDLERSARSVVNRTSRISKTQKETRDEKTPTKELPTIAATNRATILLLASTLTELLLALAPLLSLLTLPSTLSGIAHLHTYIPVLVLLGVLTLRTIDALLWSLLGSLSLTDGTANLATLLLITALFASLECLSVLFRSLSLGLRTSCNGLAGHTLSHIATNSLLLSPHTFVLTSYPLSAYALYELAVTIIQVLVYSSLTTTYL